eukprot:scaffold87135_cov17-Tisochrysis_lutea.AAC.2
MAAEAPLGPSKVIVHCIMLFHQCLQNKGALVNEVVKPPCKQSEMRDGCIGCEAMSICSTSKTLQLLFNRSLFIAYL